MDDLYKFFAKYLPYFADKVDEHWEGTVEAENDKWVLCEFYEKHFKEAFDAFLISYESLR